MINQSQFYLLMTILFLHTVCYLKAKENSANRKLQSKSFE